MKELAKGKQNREVTLEHGRFLVYQTVTNEFINVVREDDMKWNNIEG